ncbi:MAG: hypothetical protein IPN01_13060 [Deltaproteobacteria bacterium]|nr:hypothetical protein [Deltaproteobacteria bacterium]
MRTLLARPPRRDVHDAGLPVPPLGLAYLAAVLQRAGRPVELIDALALGWSWARFEAELRPPPPRRAGPERDDPHGGPRLARRAPRPAPRRRGRARRPTPHRPRHGEP